VQRFGISVEVAAMADVSDYPDAVRRILDANVDPGAVTEAEIAAALSASNAPQVTREVAQGVAENALTVDMIREAVETTGEVPTEAELDSMAAVADKYDMQDRVEAVSDASKQRFATVEDIRVSVEAERETAQSQGEPVFREDVNDAIASVEQRKELVGQSRDQVVESESRRVGAPTRQQFERAEVQAVAQGEQVSPKEAGVSDRSTPVSVITSQSGETLGVVGGSRAEDRQGVAEQVGTDRVFETVDELGSAFGLQQSEGRATVTLDGKPVADLDVGGER
jgi:hypothetical protein